MPLKGTTPTPAMTRMEATMNKSLRIFPLPRPLYSLRSPFGPACGCSALRWSPKGRGEQTKIVVAGVAHV